MYIYGKSIFGNGHSLLSSMYGHVLPVFVCLYMDYVSVHDDVICMCHLVVTVFVTIYLSN